MEFNYGNSYNNLTRNIYESLAVCFIQKGFQVVERAKMDQVLKQQKINASGLIDISTEEAQQLGKLTGSNIVLVGSLSAMGNNIAVRARMVDVEKGLALTAAEVSIEKTPDIIAAAQSGTIQKPGDSPTRQPTPEPAKPPGDSVKKAKGFTFELVSCKRQGGGVKCELFITSNADKNFNLWGSGDSRLFDDFGNVYKASGVSLASCNKEYRCKMDLIGGIRTKASLSFEGVASDATYAPVVEISCNSKGGFKVKFRDIQFK